MEAQLNRKPRTGIARWLITTVAALGATAMLAGAALAATDASSIPPNWHIHDGQVALGSQHKGIGFFPTILGQSVQDYTLDPARCPNATDKAFLPSVDSSESPLLRAGVCMTTTSTIHLRTVPTGTAGPEGWSSITAASEPGWVTYYLVTPS
jgi:hypothetical protein